MKIRVLIMMTSLLIFAHLSAYSQSHLDTESWAIVNDMGDCYCISGNFVYLAIGVNDGFDSWGPTSFQLKKVSLSTGFSDDLSYRPCGYKIALLPYDGNIIIITIDHYVDEQYTDSANFKHSYSLHITLYNALADETSTLFYDIISDDSYAYSDITIDGTDVYLLNSNGGVDIFSITARTIKNLFKTEQFITNSLYINHAITYKHKLYFSLENGDIMCFDKRSEELYCIASEACKIKSLPPYMVGHYSYFIYNDVLYYYSSENNKMQSFDLVNYYSEIIDEYRLCFWWVGSNGIFYSRLTEPRQIIYYSVEEETFNVISEYLHGGKAFLLANGYDLNVEFHHKTDW